MGRLEGKVALVTGAGTGIGRACMVMFAREGATVMGVSRTQSNLDETLAQVTKASGKGSVFSADLSDPELAEGAVETCIERYQRIDILLNAAGVGYNLRETSAGSMDPLDTTPVDKWREVIVGYPFTADFHRLPLRDQLFEIVVDQLELLIRGDKLRVVT